MLRTTRTRSAAAAVGAIAMMVTPATSFAQDESPEPEATAYPVNIHEGTCDDIAGVKFPLGEISRDLRIHTDAADAEALGGIENQNVALNLTFVDATLEELAAERHALYIATNERGVETGIACADIAGRVTEEGTLVIRLDEHDDSGYLGVALLLEQDDGITGVYSMLTETESKVDSPDLVDLEMVPLEDLGPLETMTPSDGPATESSTEASPEAEDDTTEIEVDIDVEGEDAADVEVDVEQPSEEPES